MNALSTKTDILVIYANAFDSKGEDGSIINGCTVHYLFWGENGTAMIGQSEPDITKPVGMQRGKSWVDYYLRNKIRIAPAIYEGTFKMDVDSKGKPTLKMVDIAYKSNVRMEAYKLNGIDVPGMLRDTGEENTETTEDPVTSVSDEISGDIAAGSDHKGKVPAADADVPDPEDKNQPLSDNTPVPSAPTKDHKSRKQS